MSAAERLASNLAAQERTATELEGLLENERAALDRRDWTAILETSEAKAASVRRMQSLAGELRALSGGRSPGDALAAAGLSNTWNTLLAQAARLQRANRELRTRLDSHHARIASALRVMSRAGDASLYGRDGRNRFTPALQPLARA